MAKAITIRNVPDEVHDELLARAAVAGQSLQQYVLEILSDQASYPVSADLIKQIRAEARAGGTRVTRASILTARDADRR